MPADYTRSLIFPRIKSKGVMAEKAIFAIRSGVVDSKPWTPESVLGYYGIALQKGGFSSFDMPIVEDFPVSYMVVETDDHVFKTLNIDDVLNDPPLLALDITMDTREPEAADELVNASEIFVTTFSWVVCGPKDGLGFLRELFRKTHPTTPSIKWFKPTRFVSLYADMPETEPGFPKRPPLPQACLAPVEPPPPPPVTPVIEVPPIEPPVLVSGPEPAPIEFTPIAQPAYEEPRPVADAVAPRPQPKTQKSGAGKAIAALLTLATLGYQYGGKLR